MHESDRRFAPRFRIGILLHFRLAKSSDSEPECAAETRDVSSRGACMETDAPLGVGCLLVIRMRLPEIIVGWRVPEWRIAAHVVQVEPAGNPGKFDVGVQFHYYEPLSPAWPLAIRIECGAALIAAGARVAAASGVRA